MAGLSTLALRPSEGFVRQSWLLIKANSGKFSSIYMQANEIGLTAWHTNFLRMNEDSGICLRTL